MAVPTEERIITALRESPLLPAGARVMVAVSGGPDSTALLVALKELGRDVVAAHYDHALREGSDSVAARVAELCARLGVELTTERRSAPLPRGSLQAAARSLRYEFLTRACLRSGADLVAVAHTADDLVEGAALHLMRGCGLAGFRGMPASRGRYVRPLLRVWREEVEEFLDRRNLSTHIDPANADLRHARVKLRLQVLPALERDRPGLRRRFHAAALGASTLHAEAAGQAASLLDRGSPAPGELGGIPGPVALEVLRQMYAQAGGSEPGLGRVHLDAMFALTRGGRGGRGIDLPGGLRFRIVGRHMQVVRRQSGRTSFRLTAEACAGCADSEAAHLRPGFDLHVGFRRPGLKMRPAGGRGTRKLQDMFVDARVPREDRDSWPLVFAGEDLAWVPGLAVDADHAARPGEMSVHVGIDPVPARSMFKVVRLETPISPPGEPS